MSTLKKISLTTAQQQLARSGLLALVAGLVAAGAIALYQHFAQGVVDLGALINVAVIVVVALFGLPLKDYTPEQIVQRIEHLEDLVQGLQEPLATVYKTTPLPSNEEEPLAATRLTPIVKPPAQP